MSDNLKIVASYVMPIEANMARNRLESAGIQAFLSDEHTVGLWHLGVALHGIKVLVAESDIPRAVEILKDTVEPHLEEKFSEPWVCSKCGMQVDGEMDVCWACGTTSDGIEDPEFQHAGVSESIRQPPTSQPKRPPGPLLALFVSFVIPTGLLITIFGLDFVLSQSMFVLSAVLLVLFLACELVLVVGLFQQWYYQPPPDHTEIPDDRLETSNDENDGLSPPSEDDNVVAVDAPCKHGG